MLNKRATNTFFQCKQAFEHYSVFFYQVMFNLKPQHTHTSFQSMLCAPATQTSLPCTNLLQGLWDACVVVFDAMSFITDHEVRAWVDKGTVHVWKKKTTTHHYLKTYEGDQIYQSKASQLNWFTVIESATIWLRLKLHATCKSHSPATVQEKSRGAFSKVQKMNMIF